jgi:exodeoxyribonuclease VII small subunit
MEKMNPKNPSPNSDDQTMIDQLSYEQAFNELEKIVASLETDNQSLENSIALFERGQELVRYCTSLLDLAELKVQQINAGELVDFTPES